MRTLLWHHKLGGSRFCCPFLHELPATADDVHIHIAGFSSSHNLLFHDLIYTVSFLYTSLLKFSSLGECPHVFASGIYSLRYSIGSRRCLCFVCSGSLSLILINLLYIPPYLSNHILLERMWDSWYCWRCYCFFFEFGVLGRNFVALQCQQLRIFWLKIS